MPPPETTIIIRAFNEAKHLPALFEGLDRQSYRDFDVVVVDSGSYDGSQEIARDRAHEVVEISSHDFTFGYSLNVGIAAARGRFIAIMSAHTEPVGELWLERLITPLRNDGVAMVYGRQLGARASKFSEVEDFERLFGTARRIQEHPDCFANNANSAIRKDLWQQVPFDESLPGLEDIGWSKHWMERGYQTVYEPDAVLYHFHDETWRQVRNRYHREALAACWIGIKGRRHAISEVARECAWCIADLVKTLRPGQNPTASRLTLGQRILEVLLFRVNKGYGTVSGLMDGKAMANPIEREKMFFDRTGEAVIVHGPHKAALDEVPVPEVKPGDVLIRVAHVGVCDTDLAIYAGSLGYYKTGLATYPIIPGHEFSGFVAVVGSRVSNLRIGDPVVVECIQSCGTCVDCRRGDNISCRARSEVGIMGRDGAYSKYLATAVRFVHKLPPATNMREATLCQPIAVVLKGLRRLKARLPSSGGNDAHCAVIGSGPLGHLCAKILVRQGYRVTSFDRSAKRLALISGNGIETSQDFEDLTKFDYVIEASGNSDALDSVFQRTTPGTVILLLGSPYGAHSFSIDTIAAHDRIVIGSIGSEREDFTEAVNLMSQLDLSDFTKTCVPLERFRDAWELSARDDVLKAMIDVA